MTSSRGLLELLTVKVITDKSFSQYEGFDLSSTNGAELTALRVSGDEVYGLSFKTRLAQHFDVPIRNIRLWACTKRMNGSLRPDYIIDDSSSQTIQDIFTSSSSPTTEMRLYLDTWDPSKNEIHDQPQPSDTSSLQAPEPFGGIKPRHLMIFLKHFDVRKQALCGVGKVYVSPASRIGEVLGTIKERMHWSADLPIDLYEEIKPGVAQSLDATKTFRRSELQNGDIICFQLKVSSREVADMEYRGMATSVPQFYDSLANPVYITFKPRDKDRDGGDFELAFAKKTGYRAMMQQVGHKIKHDPQELLLYTCDLQAFLKVPSKPLLDLPVEEIVRQHYPGAQSIVLFYERLNFNVMELGMKRRLQVAWIGSYNKEQIMILELAKGDTVKDLQDEIMGFVTLSSNSSGKISVFGRASNGRVQKQFDGSELIGNLPEAGLCAEEILRDVPRAQAVDGPPTSPTRRRLLSTHSRDTAPMSVSSRDPVSHDALVFRGLEHDDCTMFIRALRQRAFEEGHARDYAWMADFAATCFVGDALRWYDSLDDEIQENWKLLQRALLTKYPPPVPQSSVAETSYAGSEVGYPTGISGVAAAAASVESRGAYTPPPAYVPSTPVRPSVSPPTPTTSGFSFMRRQRSRPNLQVGRGRAQTPPPAPPSSTSFSEMARQVASAQSTPNLVAPFGDALVGVRRGRIRVEGPKAKSSTVYVSNAPAKSGAHRATKNINEALVITFAPDDDRPFQINLMNSTTRHTWLGATWLQRPSTSSAASLDEALITAVSGKEGISMSSSSNSGSTSRATIWTTEALVDGSYSLVPKWETSDGSLLTLTVVQNKNADVKSFWLAVDPSSDHWKNWSVVRFIFEAF